MLLFADGFENFDIPNIGEGTSYSIPDVINSICKKWDYAKVTDSWSGNRAEIISTSERKGARCLYNNGMYLVLSKIIKKSRTVFVGFAYKITTLDTPIKLTFYSNKDGNNGFVCSCTITFSTNAINYSWVFTDSWGSSDVDAQYYSIDIAESPTDKFIYHEVGLTLNGNSTVEEGRTAWVETRVGGGLSSGLISNIATTGEIIAGRIGTQYVWLDRVRIETTTDYDHYLDDVYMCNDEGSYNNTFLGDTRIRAMIPENVGSINNASMIGFEGSRHVGVACDFVNTLDEVPDTWDYDTYPDLIEYANPLDLYLRMSEDDQQLFYMTNPNYGGSNPEVFGVVATTICKAYADTGKKARLELIRRHGTEAVEVSENTSMEKPIQYYDDWSSYTLAMDNTDELTGTQQSTEWTPEVIGADQWGVKLVEWSDDPIEYLTDFLRLNIQFEEVLYDYLDMPDFAHRHWDREVDESLSFESYAANYWAQFAYENLDLNGSVDYYRRIHKGISEVLYLVDDMPWLYLFIKEVLSLQPEMIFAHGGTLSETLGTEDSAYQEWVEELTSELFPTTSKVSSDMIEFVAEVLTLTIPLIWDNHETINEDIQILESYIWSNHDLLIEYMTYHAEAKNGVGLTAFDSFDAVDDHFDGNWVEQIEDGWQMWFEGIVQQWRHEWFIGVIIASTRIAPIEDTGQWGGDGMDGDREGYNSW